MNNNQQNVPNRRFKAFETGPNWERRKVTELGKIFIGLVTTMTEHYKDEGVLLIRNSDIKDGRFEFGDNPIYLEETFAQANSSRMHKLGDVITVHTGDVGTSSVIREKQINSLGFATIVTRPNTLLITSDYLCSYLNTPQHKKWAVGVSTGDGRTNYNLGDYYECIVPVPSKEEQHIISEFISCLNNVITLHQHKLNKLKNLKKSYLAELFPAEGERVPKRRFSGFEGEWEEKRIGEILETLPYKQFMKEPASSGDFEVIQQGHDPIIGFANGSPCNDFEDVVIFGDHTLSLYKPQKPFFVATDGVRILNGKNSMNGYYLYVLLERFKPKSEGYKRYFGILTDVEVSITNNIEEQEKIALLFQQIDKTITLQQQKLDKLKDLKKAYLNELFV